MIGDSTTAQPEPERFREAVAEAVVRARSIGEIVAWLERQQLVVAVTLGDYLLKSNPPRRQIHVKRIGANDAPQSQVLEVLELGPDQFEFRALRDG